MHHFIYKTTNKTNSKYYIGVHSTSDIDDDYLGSGTALAKAISKHGRSQFKRDILEVFDCREAAFQKESLTITQDIVDDPQSYNICVGGFGAVGSLVPNKQTLSNMSLAQKQRYQRLGNPNKGKRHGPRSDEIKKRQRARFIVTSKNNGTYGRATRKGVILSADTRNKQSIAASKRPKHQCLHCQRWFTIQTLTRFHNDNCNIRAID